VRFVRAEVSSYEEAKNLMEHPGAVVDAMVNATGLGAKQIAGDEKVVGIRGQTVVVTRRKGDAKGEERVLIREGTEYTYVIPRTGTVEGEVEVVLGGVKQPDSFDEKVDEETRTDILERVNRLAAGKFEDVVGGEGDVQVRDIVGFRPGREGGFRIEDEWRVVPAYGFEGKGYCYSFGVAKEVGARIEPMVAE
jgi:D-amino-acid oxidase